MAQSTATITTNGILSSGTTRTANGRNNDSNQYRENRIIKCRLGISLNGGGATNLNDDNIIASNIIGPASFGTDEIGLNGILTTFQNRCIINKNNVQFVGGTFALTTAAADRVGIAVGTGTWSNTTTTTSTNSNYVITQNIVHDIVEERGSSAVGILVGTTLSGPKTNNLIANNAVFNVRSNGAGFDQAIGIGHAGGPGDRIVYNSISITGDMDPSGTTSASTSPIVGGISKHLAATADTAVFIKDNAIYVDANTNTTTLIKAAIIGPAVGYAFGSGGLDYNDYWIILSDTVNGARTGVAGTGTVSFTTLAQWKLAYTPPQDANSIQCDPMFVNVTSNLQPTTGSCLLLAGTPIAGIVDDLLKNARNVTNPTIGAYENAVAPVIDVGVISAVIGTSPGQIISVGKGYNIVATVKNFGPPVTVDSVFYTVNGGSPVGPVSAGPIPTNGTAPATFSGGNAFTPTVAGIHTIRIYTVLAADLFKSNDTLTVLVNVLAKITAYPYVQTFTNPFDWTILTENAVGTTTIWKFGIVTNPAGKTSDTAALANFFSTLTGRREVLRSPEMDISSLTNPVLHFYVAYKTFTTEDDSLEVVVSTNGGVTFFTATTVYNKGNSSVPSLATRPASTTSFFPDSSRQWRHETIDLANVSGATNLVLGFRGKSRFGNNCWIDNVIVTSANSICNNTVTTPGVYSCNTLLSVNMITVGLKPSNIFQESDNQISNINKSTETENIIGSFSNYMNDGSGITNVINQTDNPTGGVLTTTTHLNQDPPSLATPKIAPNTTATNPSGGITQPNVIYRDYWFTVTYTGNDKLGYATYNISIDVSTFTDTDSLYIVKRADMTASWVALSTTLTGSFVTASGLTTFSDFALAGDSIQQPLPVELSAFTSTIHKRDVTLNWTTASELNNSGFDIERSIVNGEWSKVGNVNGNGTSTVPHNYSFVERGLATGKYNYRLKQIDFNGNFTYYDLSNEVIVGVPTKFDLSQNYPNPFNPATKINYDLPFDSKVSIKLFDLSGREVASLVNEVKTAGYHTINFNASNLSSGVYFYKISAEGNGNSFVSTKKMMLIK